MRRNAHQLRCEACQKRAERVYKPFDSILGRADGFGKCSACGGKLVKYFGWQRRIER